MLHTVLGAVLPIVVTMLLGFVAAWHHDFDAKQASTLNKMVLLYAIPVGLFVQTVRVQRSVLSQDMPIVIALLSALVGLYVVVFLASRFAFHCSYGLSGLIALAASAPAVPFMGPAILTDLFHANGGVLIGTASLIENLSTVPLTILFLTFDGASKPDQPSNKDSKAKGSPFKVLLSTLAHTVRQPIVWVPVIAFGLVLLNIHMSPLVVHSLSLLGEPSGGVALFATGIILAGSPTKIGRSVLVWVALKNLIQPGLVFLGMRLLFHHGPEVSQTVLTLAIPMMPIAVMLATEHQVAQTEVASAVFLSVITSFVTMGIFIALTT